jgi:hypothetical protein
MESRKCQIFSVPRQRRGFFHHINSLTNCEILESYAIIPIALERHTIARALSIVGHPGLLVPFALSASAAVAGRSAQTAILGAAVGAVLALIGFAFCLWRVRIGAWQHIDASRPQERIEMNTLLLVLLFGSALLLILADEAAFVVLGLVFGGVMVVVAVLLRHRMNLSLHVAFAAFATSLLWPNLWALTGGAAFTLALAWSRLELHRHANIEVRLGFLVGVLTGAAMQFTLARLPQ